MLGLIKTRRGRKAAISLIAPFVEASRSRLSDLTEEAWLSPYIVGFMTMLISLIAERATGGLTSQSAGLVQLEAWQRVTGCNNNNIGEEICLLSSGNDPFFQEGCINAARFLAAITRGASDDPHLPRGYADHGIDYDPAVATLLWAEYFDARVNTNFVLSRQA